MRTVVLLAAAVVVGCSSSGPPGFTPVSERFSTAGTSSGMPDFTTTATVRLADFAQGCPFVALDGGNEIFLTVSPNDGGALAAGTFSVAANCTAGGPACVIDGLYTATSGTVTLTGVSEGALAGSYDVHVSNGSDTSELSGGFSASFCSD